MPIRNNPRAFEFHSSVFSYHSISPALASSLATASIFANAKTSRKKSRSCTQSVVLFTCQVLLVAPRSSSSWLSSSTNSCLYCSRQFCTSPADFRNCVLPESDDLSSLRQSAPGSTSVWKSVTSCTEFFLMRTIARAKPSSMRS